MWLPPLWVLCRKILFVVSHNLPVHHRDVMISANSAYCAVSRSPPARVELCAPVVNVTWRPRAIPFAKNGASAIIAIIGSISSGRATSSCVQFAGSIRQSFGRRLVAVLDQQPLVFLGALHLDKRRCIDVQSETIGKRRGIEPLDEIQAVARNLGALHRWFFRLRSFGKLSLSFVLSRTMKTPDEGRGECPIGVAFCCTGGDENFRFSRLHQFHTPHGPIFQTHTRPE